MTVTISAADLALLNAGSPVTLQAPVPPPKPNPLTVSGFAPTSGGIGTQFVINGTGFTGATGVKIGGLTFAPTKVVSDVQIVATVPSGAATGNIAVITPQGVAFDNSIFTVTGSAAPPSVVTPPPTGSGTPSSTLTPSTGIPQRTITPLQPPSSGMKFIKVKGSQFVDQNGNGIVPNGVNLTGLENTAVQGWDGSNYWGDSGFPGMPPVELLKAWGVNAVRIPYNTASWLGTICVDGTGTKIIPADPAGIYPTVLDQAVLAYTAAGFYIVIEQHWSAPWLMTIPNYPKGVFLAPQGQGPFSDMSTSPIAFAQIAKRYSLFTNMILGAFNEPFPGSFGPTVPANQGLAMLNGGTCARFVNNTDNGSDYTINEAWEMAGWQTMVNAARNAGFTGPIGISGVQYAQDLSEWLNYKPTDPLNNIFADWHLYPTFNAAFNSASYILGNYGAPNSQGWNGATGTCYSWALAIKAAGYPVFITEYGGQNSAGSPPDQFVASILPWAKANNIGTLAWAFCVTGEPNNNLLKDTNGTPCDGFPIQVKAFLLAQAA